MKESKVQYLGATLKTIEWSQFVSKAREFQKNIYLCFIGYAKAFDCVDHEIVKSS